MFKSMAEATAVATAMFTAVARASLVFVLKFVLVVGFWAMSIYFATFLRYHFLIYRFVVQ